MSLPTSLGRVDLADLRGATHTGFSANEAAAVQRGDLPVPAAIPPRRVSISSTSSPALGQVGALTMLAPRLRRRIDMTFIACRAWRADHRELAIVHMKEAKRAPEPGFVGAAATETAAVALAMFGAGASDAVASIACGHSRTPECMGKRLAAATAEALGTPYCKLFADRFLMGVSHPKEFRNLPPLAWCADPIGRTLVVDDIATSGWHLKEAIDLIRMRGFAASALVWIGGELCTDGL